MLQNCGLEETGSESVHQVIVWQVDPEMVVDIHFRLSTSLSCLLAVCGCADFHAP